MHNASFIMHNASFFIVHDELTQAKKLLIFAILSHIRRKSATFVPISLKYLAEKT